ncbi:MBL fold metallo-hydrolase [Motiliproteus sp.]|uniref:MBL fold metallo-hydrolase n=1 Tax=Motiliproteus sp. TaxID=1898955 RepID=UPI003BAC7B9C
MAVFELQILGVGGGISHIYQSECSSSLLLLRHQQPWALIDLGLGVVDALHRQGWSLPERVLISHNHTDHAGELPVVLRVEQAAGRRLQVLAETGVCQRLIEHRMAEHAQLIDPHELAEWRSAEAGERVDLGAGLTLEWLPTRHSERCFGFLLYLEGAPLLGYSADSGELTSLYQRLCEAPTVIFDARETGSDWHAGFDQIQPWLAAGRYLISHGIPAEQQPDYRYRGRRLPLLQPGQRLVLGTATRGEPEGEHREVNR